MRRTGVRGALLLAALALAGCGSDEATRPTGGERATGGEAPRGTAAAAGPSLDPDLYRSVLVVDVEALRRVDPRAPRDALVGDVVGGDPLLGALLPRGFRSLSDVRRIEYRARGFAAEAWGLLVAFDGPVGAALAARDLEAPSPGAAVELPGARPTAGALAAEDVLLVAPRESLADEEGAASTGAHVTLEADELAAWRLTHVDEEFRGRESALPRELFLRARRHPSPALLRLEIRGVYPDASSAEAGARHWEGLRRSLASNTWVGLTGLDRPLSEAHVVRQDATIGFTTTLRASELRVLLAAVAAMHGRPEAD